MNKKVAIVTGGGKGIGEAIVKKLVEDGFFVGIAEVDLECAKQLEAQYNGEVKAYYCDVSQSQDVEKLIEEVVDDFGQLDVMVNNAGLSREYGILEMTGEQFEQLWKVNVSGVLFGIQAAAKQFIKQGHGGKIINASSIGGYRVQPAHAGYSATKFAVRSLTQAAARELGMYNITTNCYCPGYVMTPMMEDIITNLSQEMNITKEQLIAKKSQEVALQRPAYPEDIANVVSFMASEQADYMNGQAIIVDGGIIYK